MDRADRKPRLPRLAPMHRADRKPRLPRLAPAALCLLLAAAAALQVGALAQTAAARLRQVPAELDLLCAPRPPSPPSAPMLAFRSLRPLAPRVPAEARTLVVTAVLEPVQYQFYLMPRPVRLLVQLDDQTIAAAARAAPEHAHLLHDRRRVLEAHGTRLSAERLAEGLAWAEHLVVFGPPPALLAPHLSAFELVDRVEAAALYRPRRR